MKPSTIVIDLISLLFCGALFVAYFTGGIAWWIPFVYGILGARILYRDFKEARGV